MSIKRQKAPAFRRAQKPGKSAAIQGIIGAVPFLNAVDDPAELTHLAEKSIPSELVPDSFVGVFPPNRPSLVRHLRHTRDLCRELLRVALWAEDYREMIGNLNVLPDREAEQAYRAGEEAKIKARNKEVAAVLNASRVEVYWRHRGYTTSQVFLIDRDTSKKTTPEEHAEILRARLVRWIVETFDTEAGKPGAAWVGVCPRCHDVFEKKRGDQEYCGKPCADTVSKRRQRKRMSDD